MPATRILLVEDDPVLRTGLTDNLEAEGFEVKACADGIRASRLLEDEDWSLVVLDWMLPGKSGIDVLRELRIRDSAVPVLLLTAKADEADKVIGLELGADDYVTKPFGLRELMARIRACLRRGSRDIEASREEAPHRFTIGSVDVDLDAFELHRDEERVPLSRKEAGILALLIQDCGKVVPRRRFLDELWGRRFVGNRSIDTHILNLRKKIEQDPRDPQHLLTAHGVGYRLVP